jgi:hypothetical protein
MSRSSIRIACHREALKGPWLGDVLKDACLSTSRSFVNTRLPRSPWSLAMTPAFIAPHLTMITFTTFFSVTPDSSERASTRPR